MSRHPRPRRDNLVTAVADAFLDRAPLVALTGQSDLERTHKESHQYIDLVDILRRGEDGRIRGQ